MSNETATRITAAAGFLAVALGAFGAHGLKDVLAQNNAGTIWAKAVFYHFVHVVVMLVISSQKRFAAGAWWSFLTGIVLFSGSLYLLAVTNLKWLGAITPIGGLGFLVGWTCLLISAGRNKWE